MSCRACSQIADKIHLSSVLPPPPRYPSQAAYNLAVANGQAAPMIETNNILTHPTGPEYQLVVGEGEAWRPSSFQLILMLWQGRIFSRKISTLQHRRLIPPKLQSSIPIPLQLLLSQLQLELNSHCCRLVLGARPHSCTRSIPTEVQDQAGFKAAYRSIQAKDGHLATLSQVAVMGVGHQ